MAGWFTTGRRRPPSGRPRTVDACAFRRGVLTRAMLDRMGRAPWSLALLVACVSLLAAGCPSNTCLLTVNGRCTWSTCPDGADFDTQRRTCVCQQGRIALGGGCLTYDAANRYCGKGAHFENGGCAPNRCPPGLEIDQDTGMCI